MAMKLIFGLKLQQLGNFFLSILTIFLLLQKTKMLYIFWAILKIATIVCLTLLPCSSPIFSLPGFSLLFAPILYTMTVFV